MPDRVIVDITGGTKVMVAAMIHAALTQRAVRQSLGMFEENWSDSLF